MFKIADEKDKPEKIFTDFKVKFEEHKGAWSTSQLREFEQFADKLQRVVREAEKQKALAQLHLDDCFQKLIQPIEHQKAQLDRYNNNKEFVERCEGNSSLLEITEVKTAIPHALLLMARYPLSIAEDVSFAGILKKTDDQIEKGIEHCKTAEEHFAEALKKVSYLPFDQQEGFIRGVEKQREYLKGIKYNLEETLRHRKSHHKQPQA